MRVNRGNRIACRQRNELIAPGQKERVGIDEKRRGAPLAKRSNVFPKSQLPPVKGFWSLTVYDRQHLFYANDLNRYSLGTKSYKTLKYDPDGALTLYLGNKSPEQLHREGGH